MKICGMCRDTFNGHLAKINNQEIMAHPFVTIGSKIKTSELQLGDTIKTGDLNWSYAIVKQVDSDYVHIFRPYGTTADFTYTGGVICYVGIEEYKIEKNSSCEWELCDRKVLK